MCCCFACSSAGFCGFELWVVFVGDFVGVLLDVVALLLLRLVGLWCLL